MANSGVRVCRMHDVDLALQDTDASGAPVAEPAFATRITIDTLTGETTETTLADTWSLDFPVVPAAAIARFTPFSYMTGNRISPDSPCGPPSRANSTNSYSATATS